MTNILVVDTSGASAGNGGLCENSVLGFRTVLPDSSLNITSAIKDDPDYPFDNCVDFPDNTKFSPDAESGTFVIELAQPTETIVSYVGIAIHNAQSAGLYAKVEHWTGSAWVTLTELTSLADNKPFMAVFDPVNSRKQRITLTFTSKLYIGTIYIGEALQSLSTPSLGFQPAKFAPLDEVEQFTTEGNNTVMGRRIHRGWQAKGSFDFVRFDALDDFYAEYQNWVLDSKPIFFKWANLRDEVVFGRQNPDRLTKPTYKTPYHGTIEFEINGYQ